MNLFVLTLLSFLLGGGGNDLLDYVPSDYYWKSKQVEISVETLSAQLTAAKANESVGSQAIRRLMAIRNLGELQNPAAIPLLQTFIKSDEPFVAEYATAAIARIERKPFTRARVEGSERDVWLLPASSGAVVHVNLASGHVLDYERVFKQLSLPRDEDKAMGIDFIAGLALDWAERIGNVRLDAITVGVSADFDIDAANVTLILAGKFDRRATEEFSRRQKTVFEMMDGVKVFRPDPETFNFRPSDRRMIVVLSKKGNAGPVADMVKAVKSGEGSLKSATALADLVRTIDVNAPVWGCMLVGDDYRKVSVLNPFDSVTLSSARRGEGIALRLQARVKPMANTKASADNAASIIGRLDDQVRHSQADIPSIGLIGDVLKSAKISFSATAITIDAEVKQSAADSFLLPLMMTFGVPRMHAEPIPK